MDVNDTTHLKGGVISSTGGDSHLNTGKLIAESQKNHSKWDATSTGGGLSLGTDALGGTLGLLGVIAGNMAANSGLIAGGNRKHDETSTSQSAISGNVTVNAGSTEGGYTTDVSSADGHLDNKFDAEKLANQLQNSQLGMQLVGEVMGQISDALHNSGVNGFDETKLSNDWGRIILEAAGSAAVAGVTGGNFGSAAVSSAAGTATVVATGQFIADNALSLENGDKDLAILLTNIGMNIAASIGSALQQYNAAVGKLTEKLVSAALKAAQKAAELSGNKTLINLTKDINKIDDVVETIEHSAVGEKIPNGSPELTPEQQQIIENAENVSTANPSKGTYDHPRDLQEQIFWKEVESNPDNPADGKVLEGLNN